MDRSPDAVLGFGLLTVGLTPLGTVLAVAVWSRPPVLGSHLWVVLGTLAVGWSVLVCPAGYKLLRYPSTRTVSLGRLVAEFRRRRLGPMRSGMLVCFSGIDGSGKTTQAQRLVEEFEARDIPAVHVWARWRPFVSYPVMGILYVLFRWRRKDYHRSRLLTAVWGYLVLLDQLLFFARHLLVPLLRGKIVFVDRYLLDQFVEFDYDGLYNRRVVRLFLRFLPSPDRTFLMDVPVETALERKDDTQEMLDRLRIDADERTYLETRRELYQSHARELEGVTIVNTSRQIAETHQEIRDSTFDAYFRF